MHRVVTDRVDGVTEAQKRIGRIVGRLCLTKGGGQACTCRNCHTGVFDDPKT